MADFFISYNKADRTWAVWIAWELEAAGYTTIIQEWDFRPGSNFPVEMHHAAAKAQRTILVLSPDYLGSKFTAAEWAAAFVDDPAGAQRKLVPVRVRPCQPTGLLKPITRIDLVELDEASARKSLLAGVKQRRAKPSQPPAYPGTPSSPRPSFPGSAKRNRANQRKSQTPPQTLSAAAVAARFEQLQWGVRPDRGRGGWTGRTWLGIVLVPERTGATYIDELSLGDSDLHDQVLALALGGSRGIFRPSRRSQPQEQADHIAFTQYDDRSDLPVAQLETYSDGTLVYRTVIEQESVQHTFSLAESHIIDEQAVQRAIASFVGFAGQYYKQRRRDPGGVHLGLSLAEISFKHFGRTPTHQLNGFTIGDPRLNDPLQIPTTPLRITKTQLAKPEMVAETVVAHIARVFRLANAYYPSSQH